MTGWEASAARLIRALLVGSGIVVAGVLGLRVLMLAVESRLTFLPVRGLEATPAALGLPYEDLYPVTRDGVRLHGWFIPADPAAARARQGGPLALLHFHGNAENIASLLPLAALTRAAGHHLFLVDYRGYGTSAGAPSENGLYIDGEAALAALRARPDVGPDSIVPWGRSIGSTVAVRLAADRAGVAGLILESPFTSARDLLREGGHPLLAALSRFASYRFDQTEALRRIGVPVLVIHGTRDEVIPFRIGQAVRDLVPGRAELFPIDGGGHNDLLPLHGMQLWDGARRFLDRLEPGTTVVTPPGRAPSD